MSSILFVCSANRFRSVLAAGCFQHLLAQNDPSNRINVSSAGIWARDGAPPLREAVDLAAQHGFNVESVRSREINNNLVTAADLIIVMTQGQKEAIENEFPSACGKTYMLTEISTGQVYDIPDPVISQDEDPSTIASEICDLIKTGFPRILERISRLEPQNPPATEVENPAHEEEPAQPVEQEQDTPQKTKKRRRVFWVLLVIVVLAGLFYLVWTNPLFGARLPQFTGQLLQTFTPLPAVSTSMAATDLAATTTGPQINDHGKTEENPLNATPSPAVCGQTEPMFILGLGIDEVEQADVIRLIRVDFTDRRVLVLSIPRDFWVPIPGLEQHNITQFRINAAYGYGEYFNGRGQGVVKFSETIYYNYGITFDHYGAVHFNVFKQLIDAVGGVDFYLDGPIGAYSSKGNHHMDGKAALEFVRQRKADLDRYRIMRQSVIMNALIEKLRQPENLKKLPALGFKVLNEKGVVTDLTLKDVYTFICFIQELDKDSLVFVDIPTDLYTPNTTNYGRHVKLPKPEATTFIQDKFINGNY